MRSNILLLCVVAIIALPSASAHSGALGTLTSEPAKASSPHTIVNLAPQSAGLRLVDAARGQYAYIEPEFAPVWERASGADPYDLKFKCPTAPGQQTGQAYQADGSVCPAALWDPEDLMGQPILLINRNNPDIMVFNALHGGIGIHPVVDPANPGQSSVQPPTPRSRYNLLHHPHTNWWTDRGGNGWNDEPYFAPDFLVEDGRKVFGEDNAAVMDAWGREYHASLYSYASPNQKTPQWAVAAWMHERTNQRPYGYTDYVMLKADDPTNPIDSVHMVVAPEADRVFTFWRESTLDNKTRSPYVNIFYTALGNGLQWERLGVEKRVGPCRAITNGVSVAGKIYFGCLPGDGYKADNNTDYYQIHEIDARTLDVKHVAATPIGDGGAVLAKRGPHGHMILAVGGVENGKPFVRVSYGVLGKEWTDVADYGKEFSRSQAVERDGRSVVDARVNALAYTERTGFVHIVYSEKYTTDPEKIDPTQLQPKTLHKTYGVVRPNHAYVGKFDLKFGEPSRCQLAAPPGWAGIGEGVYEDLHDSINVFHDATTDKERIFVAYAEYGCVRFAEVEEETPLVALPLVPPAPPPVPLAVSAAQPAYEAAAAGLVMGLMLLRLLAAKRKTAVAAAAK